MSFAGIFRSFASSDGWRAKDKRFEKKVCKLLFDSGFCTDSSALCLQLSILVPDVKRKYS